MRITKGFKQLIILSVIIGEFSVIMGLVLAFYMNISPGGYCSTISFIIRTYNVIPKSIVRLKKGNNL